MDPAVCPSCNLNTKWSALQVRCPMCPRPLPSPSSASRFPMPPILALPSLPPRYLPLPSLRSVPSTPLQDSAPSALHMRSWKCPNCRIVRPAFTATCFQCTMTATSTPAPTRVARSLDEDDDQEANRLLDDAQTLLHLEYPSFPKNLISAVVEESGESKKETKTKPTPETKREEDKEKVKAEPKAEEAESISKKEPGLWASDKCVPEPSESGNGAMTYHVFRNADGTWTCPTCEQINEQWRMSCPKYDCAFSYRDSLELSEGYQFLCAFSSSTTGKSSRQEEETKNTIGEFKGSDKKEPEYKEPPPRINHDRDDEKRHVVISSSTPGWRA